ncbi:MAG TPA: sigma-70 family RNA polymerase sigma factor [Capsulimonadaceae bacterium]|jgi:DNA-directed RNA polymerase specialized sigma24 family protein
MNSATEHVEPDAIEYAAEPRVAAEIARLSGLPSRRLLAALGASDENVQEETLVHFLRACHAAGDSAASGEIARIITGRIAGSLARLARAWRLSAPRDLMEDVIDEVLTDVYEQLFDSSPKFAFWEVRFWVCFNRRAINVMRRRRGELDQVAADEEFDEDSEELHMESVEPSRLRFDEPMGRALLADALGHLPQEVRTAFMLKHWSGYVEESSDSGETSIATLMGVSGRTVRNYLTRATRDLAAWREGTGDE